MLLTEIFSKDVPYEIVRAKPHNFVTRAIIGGRQVNFMADHFDEGRDDPWTIMFSEVNAGVPTYGKTGKGHEFEVFSFVANSLKEFLQRYHPTNISLSADKRDGQGRLRIYKRLAGDVLKGYSAVETEHETDSSWHLDYRLNEEVGSFAQKREDLVHELEKKGWKVIRDGKDYVIDSVGLVTKASEIGRSSWRSMGLSVQTIIAKVLGLHGTFSWEKGEVRF